MKVPTNVSCVHFKVTAGKTSVFFAEILMFVPLFTVATSKLPHTHTHTHTGQTETQVSLWFRVEKL